MLAVRLVVEALPAQNGGVVQAVQFLLDAFEGSGEEGKGLHNPSSYGHLIFMALCHG